MGVSGCGGAAEDEVVGGAGVKGREFFQGDRASFTDRIFLRLLVYILLDYCFKTVAICFAIHKNVKKA